MAFTDTAPNTGTSLSTMAPDSVRKLWKKGLLMAEENGDFFQELESKSGSAIICAKTDTSKGKGQTLTFTNLSGFYDEPHYNEELFEDADDFEDILIDDFKLVVDWIRHATRYSERMEELMGMRGEITSKTNMQLGDWLGRMKSEQLFAMFQLKLNSDNVLYANGKTRDTLLSADTLVWDEVVTMGQSMKPRGGLPARLGTHNGAPVWGNMVVATEAALFSLKLDPSYQTLLQNAGVDGKRNELFKGGYPYLDGHVIKPYNPIDHDGVGAVGSFMNPKAFLGTAVAAGTTTFDVTGGGNATNGAITKKKYFKHFPNYAYKFTDGDHTPATAARYFLIYNLTGADAGKMGMYSYTTGNDGNKITIVNRLGSAASGARVTTLGGVTWDTGVWSGKHTDAHPSGSLIIPCNSKGVPIGSTLMLGRMAAMRGYGKYRGHRTQDTKNGGFITERFITSVFGQVIREDRLGRHPAVVRLEHAISYPGLNFPVVVS